MHAGVHNARTSAPGRRGPGPGLERPYAAFDVVAMVASTGGLRAYSRILSALPADFPAAILVVQQRDPRQPGLLADLLSRRTELRVQPAADGERLRPGTVHIAPAEGQLRLSPDRRLALCPESEGAFPGARGRADALFASVAETVGARAIALVLTGSGEDGADGVRAIKRLGGRVLVQDRATAEAFGQPGAAICTGCIDFVLPLERIAGALVSLVMVRGADALFKVPLPHWAALTRPPAPHEVAAGPLPGVGLGGQAAALTPREREVAALVAHGLTNRQIAAELVLTPGTVANHVEHIRTKLGFHSRAQVAAWAVEQGLTTGRAAEEG